MTNFSPTLSFAKQLDSQDPLASFRDQFVITDPDLIYLDGNSLGRMPKVAQERARQVTEEEWGHDLIRGWNKGWWEAPQRVGDKIGKLIGAAEGQTLVNDTVSVNLFKLATSALTLQPNRKRIITDTFNFPSDLYILQGIKNLLSSGGRDASSRDHQILRIGAIDDDITPDIAALESAIDEDTALVTLSHVVFKSGYLYDMRRITDLTHAKGALVLWDLSHSVGSVPVHLDDWDADFAIGCTYKYLNGGPGSPAFLYVRRDLQQQLMQPMWGWFAAENPFAFDLEFSPAEDISRFRVGTPPMLSMKAIEPAVDLLLEAGMERLRAKSAQQTDYLIALADAWLEPLGFTVGSPRQSDRRGSHVSLRHPEAYRINRALIEAEPPALKVIPDFRAPDNIRLGVTPLYTTFTEIYRALERIRTIAAERIYEQYSTERLAVT